MTVVGPIGLPIHCFRHAAPASRPAKTTSSNVHPLSLLCGEISRVAINVQCGSSVCHVGEWRPAGLQLHTSFPVLNFQQRSYML